MKEDTHGGGKGAVVLSGRVKLARVMSWLGSAAVRVVGENACWPHEWSELSLDTKIRN